MSFGVSGQRLEAEIGLYFYNARFYDATLGRFTQADTIIPCAGNVLALDRYAYVKNNSLRYNDPSGHFPWIPIIIGGIVIIGGGVFVYDRFQTQKEINNDIVQNRAVRDQIGGELVTQLSDVVTVQASERGISPDLINAIIRHESGAAERRFFGSGGLANFAERGEASFRYFVDNRASIGIGQVQMETALMLERSGYATRQGRSLIYNLLEPELAVEYIAGNLQYISDQLTLTYGNPFAKLEIEKRHRLIVIGYNLGWNGLKKRIGNNNFDFAINSTKYDERTLDDYYSWRDKIK